MGKSVRSWMRDCAVIVISANEVSWCTLLKGSQFTFCLLLASLYLQLSWGTQSWFTAQLANDDFVAIAIINLWAGTDFF